MANAANARSAALQRKLSRACANEFPGQRFPRRPDLVLLRLALPLLMRFILAPSTSCRSNPTRIEDGEVSAKCSCENLEAP